MSFGLLARSWRTRSSQVLGLLRASIALVLCVGMAFGQSINVSNWGTVTAPVYNQAESNPNYSNAEILAGPNKFGSYFAGVLPNGRKVTPAGNSIQIGMNPLGIAITPDGQYLVSSNDDEREGGDTSYQSQINLGGYSLTVVDTGINAHTYGVVSQFRTSFRFFVGVQITGPAGGPYTVWAAGGPDNDVKLFSLSGAGVLTSGVPANIAIPPTHPQNAGFVNNYLVGAPLSSATSTPSGFSTNGAKISYPAGLQLSPNGKYLYVACNGDNSVAVIDTATKGILKQVPAGAFPYGVAVNGAGTRIAVSNWGIMDYKFFNPTYDAGTGQLIGLGSTPNNTPVAFDVPPVTKGKFPLTSSVHIYTAAGGFGSLLTPKVGKYLGHPLDVQKNNQVGDTHPSAMAVVKSSIDGTEYLFVAKTNDDHLGRLVMTTGKPLTDYDLGSTFVTYLNNSGLNLTLAKGTYPNALAVSPDNTKLFVAESGINSVAVVDVTDPLNPNLLGRIPTGWYPTGLAVSPDGSTLYIANAKGVGEDVNPAIPTDGSNGQVPPPTGLASNSSPFSVDSNYIFGSLQQVDLTQSPWDDHTVLANNFAVQNSVDTSVVPMGGTAGSPRIKTVIFIMHENKTFDSMLGNLGAANSGPFGNFAGTVFNNQDGSTYSNGQYTGVSLNTQALASAFATAVNYYSDSEESDAGHQFFASGTASDYTEKTLLVKGGRGLLVNKNFEPEDYPEGGYIFNNLSRFGRSFKNYGMMIRIEGTDTGTSKPTTLNDPLSGSVGYPQLLNDGFTITSPVQNLGDPQSGNPTGTATQTQGLGQTFFMNMPGLAVLGTNNKNGTARTDLNYPAYNFNISDQRRALEFIKDFDSLVANNQVPQFLFIYQPNDHTGSIQAPNAAAVVQTICTQFPPSNSCSPLQQIGDGDTALGMVVQHIMKSPVYYDANKNTGAAIFISYDDAQSSLDHVHPHRTPMVVVSPFAKPGFVATRHYVTASVVKTGELMLGVPANNFGDLFATDLRDMFQSTYNQITADQVNFNLDPSITPSAPAKKIWALVTQLDTASPDRDSRRLGALIRMTIKADELFHQAENSKTLETASYQKQQNALYEQAVKLVNAAAPADNDD
jgi:YVTN family beta-propeller protein